MEYSDNTESLTHHGIPGMKWGIRRYQNKDGSLTPAGKKRADKMKEEYTALTGKRLIRKPTKKTSEEDQNGQENSSRKQIKEMSDNEIKNKINRLQMEKQLMGLQSDTASGKEKFISTVGKQVVAPAAIEAGKRLLTDALMKIGKEKLGLNPAETKDAFDELRKEVDGLELEARKIKANNTINNNKNQHESKKKKSSEDNNSKKESETVKAKPVGNIYDDMFKKKRSKSSDPVIIDMEDIPSNSTELVPYKKRKYR